MHIKAQRDHCDAFYSERAIIIPETTTIRALTPRYGWCWVRPTAVSLIHDGETKRFPIRDYTLLIQVLCLVISLVVGLAGFFWRRRRIGERDET